MKWIASTLVLIALAGQVSSVSAQCRPTTLPPPGGPQDPSETPPTQIVVDEVTNQVAPIPFLVFIGDVVLIDGDAALAAQQECNYYQLGVIDPSTWSDVLHIDNTETGGQATLYSDCEPGNPNDPCNPPYEIDLSAQYQNAAQLVNPVFIVEATEPTVYQPIPGVDVYYLIYSDVERPPGVPRDCRRWVFKLTEQCQGSKSLDGKLEEPIKCVMHDPVTGCPAYQLDLFTAFSPGWVRIHEGSLTAPVSDLLHFFNGQFVAFCSDPPDSPKDPAEPVDVGIPEIPAGDPDPIVDIVEDATPVVYSAGKPPCSADYLIYSDPPEPVPAQKSTWGQLKARYR